MDFNFLLKNNTIKLETIDKKNNKKDLKDDKEDAEDIFNYIEKKFEIISFNRPLSLKHGQILPINEDINNKRIIKLNRPLSLNEFLFQFDFDTHIHNMQKKILLNKMNKYYSSLINLFETKVLTNKEIS